MDPRVVRSALDHASRAIARERNAVNVDTLTADLAECEKAIRRLTSAIASGGDLPTLITALEAQERRRTELRRGSTQHGCRSRCLMPLRFASNWRAISSTGKDCYEGTFIRHRRFFDA